MDYLERTIFCCTFVSPRFLFEFVFVWLQNLWCVYFEVCSTCIRFFNAYKTLRGVVTRYQTYELKNSHFAENALRAEVSFRTVMEYLSNVLVLEYTPVQLF